MPEHLTESEIELYRRGDDNPAGRQITTTHLAICEHCVKRVFDKPHSTLAVNGLSEALLASVDEEPFHLSHPELKAYVSGHALMADRIICESHIDICLECSEELRLLSGTQTALPAQSKSSSREKLAWLQSAWFSNNPARVGAMIVLIGVVALGVILMWRRPTPTPAPVAGLEPRVTPGVAAPTDIPSPKRSEPAIIVQLRDNGREISLDEQGRLAGLEESDASTQKTVMSLLAGEPLVRPNVLDEFKSPRIQLMGEPNENTFQLVGPFNQIIVEARPTLRWKPLKGATSYVASVFDSKFNLVASSAALSQLSWTLPATLRRGQSYFWQVSAMKDGEEVSVPVAPAPRAQLMILGVENLHALQKVQRQRPKSHLALGLTYARLGLLKDAEDEFQYLLKENPDSGIAKRLLRTVQTWR